MLVNDGSAHLRYVIVAETRKRVAPVIESTRTFGRLRLAIAPAIWVVSTIVYAIHPGDGGLADYFYLGAIGFLLGAALEAFDVDRGRRHPLARVRRYARAAATNLDGNVNAAWLRPGAWFLVAFYVLMYVGWAPMASLLICTYIGTTFVALIVVWSLRLRPRPSVVALFKALHAFSNDPKAERYSELREAIVRHMDQGHESAKG